MSVAENGISSEAHMRQLKAAGVKWLSRVSETSTEAKTVLQEGSQDWQGSEDGSMQWSRRIMALPQGSQRWVDVHHDVLAHAPHAGKGRPRKEARPTTSRWQIVATVTLKQQRVDEEALRQACFSGGTHELESEALADQELLTTSKDRGGVERGFRFLKDPLLLASSVTVSKPERIMALSLIMVLCLRVYPLAQYRLRARLAQTEQTIADQVHKPTARPTMRWVFQWFEGLEVLHVQTATPSLPSVLRLESVHRLILALLGPLSEKISIPSG